MTAKDTISVVEEVKIFLRGAEIKRRMVLEASKGKNTAVFEGLPQDVRPESINASVEKGGALLSADFTVDSFKEPNISKDIKSLEEKQKKVRDSIKEEMSKLDQLKAEISFLDSNKKIGGKSGLEINDLKEFERYFKERNAEIGAAKIVVEKRLEELSKEMERITKELSGHPTNVVRYAGKITVEFYAESKGEAEVTVSYFVNNAWWVPFHEIRMNDINSPVALSMKGSIVQNTGEDWNNVRIKLSTGNPMLGNQQPIIYPWYIDVVMPQKPQLRRAMKAVDENCYEMECKMAAPVAMEAAPPQAMVVESHTTTEFALPAALDIPSSNKPTKVEISKHELKADIFYYCASKLDTDAFLIAKIGGWESLNLLAGEVSIFQGNEYVGKTYLNPAVMNDDMEISLGRDKGIIVTRERGKEMTSQGLIGKDKKVTREWTITVRNTRNKEIKMKLLDQVPISANSAVTVNHIELSGAELEKETGILKWSLNIPSGGSVKKVLRYEVTYPKTGTVYLD